MFALLVASSLAFAAAPEDAAPGYRLHAAVARNRGSARLAVVPGPATTFAQTLRYRHGLGRWSLDLQQNLVQATAPDIDWTHFGVGRTVLGSRLHLGDDRRHAWVLEADAGFDDAQAWGSHSIEALPGGGMRTGWEGTWVPGRSTLIARATAGLSVSRGLEAVFPAYADSGFTWAFPVVPNAGLGGVFELEFQLVDYVPASMRLLARWEPGEGDLLIDLGGQLSSGYDDTTSAGGVIAQVGRRY